MRLIDLFLTRVLFFSFLTFYFYSPFLSTVGFLSVLFYFTSLLLILCSFSTPSTSIIERLHFIYISVFLLFFSPRFFLAFSRINTKVQSALERSYVYGSSSSECLYEEAR